MKNKLIIILSLFSFVFLCECNTQEKITYEFPEAMSASVKSQYIVMCDKGKVLFEKNCAKCHMPVSADKKKETIPEFTREQLEGYSMRESKEHASEMPDTLVSEEDLLLIMTFLTYKKKGEN